MDSKIVEELVSVKRKHEELRERLLKRRKTARISESSEDSNAQIIAEDNNVADGTSAAPTSTPIGDATTITNASDVAGNDTDKSSIAHPAVELSQTELAKLVVKKLLLQC